MDGKKKNETWKSKKGGQQRRRKRNAINPFEVKESSEIISLTVPSTYIILIHVPKFFFSWAKLVNHLDIILQNTARIPSINYNLETVIECKTF